MIVETGEGLSNSDSYANVETADAYFADRQITAWDDATTASKKAALIRATDYIDANYIFRSVRALDSQALENPRYGQDSLSPNLVKATIELALLALSIDLFAPVLERDTLIEKITAGSVSTETTYDPKAVTDRFPDITKILRSVAARKGASASSTMMSR